MDRDDSKLLFQVISECYEQRSIIVTINLEFSKCSAKTGDKYLQKTYGDISTQKVAGAVERRGSTEFIEIEGYICNDSVCCKLDLPGIAE